MNPFPLAWNELRRRPGAAAAMIVLIAAVVAFGIATSAAERALRKSSARAADRFGLLVGASGNAGELVLGAVFLQPADLVLTPAHVLDELRADAGVRYAAPLALGDSVDGHPVIGTTAAFVTDAGLVTPAEGRMFTDPREAVAGSRVRLAPGTKFRPRHGSGLDTHDAHDASADDTRHAFEFTVVGRMPATGTPWDDALMVPMESIGMIHHLDNAGASAIVVAPRTVGDAYRLRQILRAKGMLAVFPAEVLVGIFRMLGGMRDVVMLVSRASQLLVVAAVLLALLAMVESRRLSYAVLRALGAPARYIFSVTWLQCFALFVAGATVGIAAGWLLAQALSQAMTQATGVDMLVSLRREEWTEWLALLASLAVAATLPAMASLRGSVAAGLRAS